MRSQAACSGCLSDVADPLAVLEHYTSGYSAVEANRPYWLREWAVVNDLAAE